MHRRLTNVVPRHACMHARRLAVTVWARHVRVTWRKRVHLPVDGRLLQREHDDDPSSSCESFAGVELACARSKS